MKIWRYKLPNIRYEGWAVIYLDSSGFFGTVSDWGNFAYWWRSPGEDFRKFFLDMDVAYFADKLASGRAQQFNAVKTREAIKRKIIELRREKDIEKHVARREWNLIEGIQDEFGYFHWKQETRAFEDWPDDNFVHFSIASDACRYAENVLPRLQEAIQQELGQEFREAVSSIEGFSSQVSYMNDELVVAEQRIKELEKENAKLKERVI